MVNNTPNSKLDDKVKETLNNYEAKYDSPDWSRMERMLDAAPQTVSFKWSYVLNGVIAVAVCGGAYLAYNAISSSSPKQNTGIQTETTSPVPAPAKTQPVPVKPNPPVVSTGPTVTTSTETATVPANPTIQIPVNTSVTANAEPKKIKNKVPETKVEDPDLKNIRVIGMGNEPVFGDMLDSSKGIIKETKETVETKEAAKKNKDLPVGWNSFMLSNVNPDSIKSYKERIKKDSTKVQ